MGISNKLQFLQGLSAGLLTTLIFICFKMETYNSNTFLSWKGESESATNIIAHARASSFHVQDDNHVEHDANYVARKLSEQVRILVAIMTSPDNLKKRAQAVKDTWAKRCNKIIYFSSAENKTFPTIRLNVTEGYYHLTEKTIVGFQYIYDNYFNDFDWFMKADDDTYVIMENLRYFLAGQNTSEPVYFGQHFRNPSKLHYNTGGAGYVLGKEALQRFADRDTNNSVCSKFGVAEDMDFAKCLLSLGVHVGNSTDSLGRSRFHQLTPEEQLTFTYPTWYDLCSGLNKSRQDVSDYAISFHYTRPNKMVELEFLTYRLRLFGKLDREHDLNTNRTLTFN